MRIISSFRDYYDSAAGYDDVPQPTYLRETRTVALCAPGGRGGRFWQDPKGDPEAAEVARTLDGELTELFDCERYGLFEPVTPVLLGFCGALARGWRLDDVTWWSVHALLEAMEASPTVRAAMSSAALRRDLRYEREEPGGLASRPPPSFDLGIRTPRITSVFRLLDTPCFLVEPENWSGTCVTIVRDPPLEPLGFARVLDPYSARQAVETFLGNELARQDDPMDRIGDRDLRDMKGFDDRSFRADPGGPGRKRKRRRG